MYRPVIASAGQEWHRAAPGRRGAGLDGNPSAGCSSHPRVPV